MANELDAFRGQLSPEILAILEKDLQEGDIANLGVPIVWRPGATGAAAPGGNVYTGVSPFEAYTAAKALEPYGVTRFVVDSDHGPTMIPNDGVMYDFGSIIVTGGISGPLKLRTFLLFEEGAKAEISYFECLQPFDDFDIINFGTISSPLAAISSYVAILGQGQVNFSAKNPAAAPLIKVINPFNNFLKVLNLSGGRLLIGENRNNPAAAPVIDINGGNCILSLMNNCVCSNSLMDSTGTGVVFHQQRGSRQNQFGIAITGYEFPGLAAGQHVGQITGGVGYTYTSEDADFTMKRANQVSAVNTDGGVVTATLYPIGSGGTGRMKVKNTGTSVNDVTVAAPAGYTVEGGASVALADGAIGDFVFDGGTDYIQF